MFGKQANKDDLRGKIVKDRITGFTGMVMAQTKYMTGCDRVSVQSRELDKDGKPMEWQSFDVGQIDVVEEDMPKVTMDSSVPPGGPRAQEPNRNERSI